MKSSSSLRDWTLPLGQMVLESLWVYALVLVAMAVAPSPARLTPISVFGLSLSTVALARIAHRVPAAENLKRALLLVVEGSLLLVWLRWVIAADLEWSLSTFVVAITRPSALGAAVPVGSVLLSWVVGVYLAARGLILATRVQTGADVTRGFLLGAAALVALFASVALARIPERQLPVAQLRDLTVFYFSGGVAVIALAHRRSIHRSVRLQAQAGFAFALAVAVPASLVMITALLLTSGQRAGRHLLVAAATFITWIGESMLQALRWLAYGLIFLARWISAFISESPRALPPRPAPVGELLMPSVVEPVHVSGPQVNVVPVLFAAVLLLVVVSFVAVFLLGRSHREEETDLEEVESLWSWALLRRQLSHVFKSLFERVWGRRKLASPALARRSAEPAHENVNDVRRAYRALLSWAEERGQRRGAACTPIEFGEQLARGMGAESSQLSAITRYYVEARYGTRLLTAGELAHVRQLLGELPRREQQHANPSSS